MLLAVLLLWLYMLNGIYRLHESWVMRAVLALVFTVILLVFGLLSPWLHELRWQQYHLWLKSPSQSAQEHTDKLYSLRAYLDKRALQGDQKARAHLVNVCDQLADYACVEQSLLAMLSAGQKMPDAYWYLAKARFHLDADHGEAMQWALRLCWRDHGKACATFGQKPKET